MIRVEVCADSVDELVEHLRGLADRLDPPIMATGNARDLLPKNLSRAGIRMPSTRPHPAAKHSDEEVLRLARRAAIIGVKPAAIEFGVVPQWLNAVMAGKIYRRLQPQILLVVQEEQARQRGNPS